MLGYGFDPELSEGSLKPPIFLTSTFVFENAAAGKRFFEGVTGKRPGGAEGLIYSRFNGPNQEILEDRLAVWEEADDALAFSSGMSAIATLLLTFVQPGDVRRPFGPALRRDRDADRQDPRPVRRSLHRFPGRRDARGDRRRHRRRARRRAGCRSSISKARRTRPTRWSTSRRSRAARDAAFGAGERPPIAIDNTFLGPLWAKPLAQGADLSVYSLTKYVGGHSDLVAGGIVGEKGLINQIRMIRNTIGTICDPNTAWMLLRSLETLELRMEPRRRECGEGVRLPAQSSEGREGRLSRLPRGRLAPGGHLQPPLHRRRIDLLALSEGRREGGVRLPRRAADRQSRGQPRRHRDAGERARGDDPFVGARGAQEAARHHAAIWCASRSASRMPTT